MMSKNMVKIICIVLAGIMILSSVAVLTQVFAAGSAIPATGDNEMRIILPVVVVALALIAVIVCVIMPKLRKKDEE